MARQRKPVDGDTGEAEVQAEEISLSAQIAASYADADAPPMARFTPSRWL
jgi:hypothetical protein